MLKIFDAIFFLLRIMLNINRNQNFYTLDSTIIITTMCCCLVLVRSKKQTERINNATGEWICLCNSKVGETTLRGHVQSDFTRWPTTRRVKRRTVQYLDRSQWSLCFGRIFRIEIFLFENRIAQYFFLKVNTQLKIQDLRTMPYALFILSGYFSTIRNVLQRDKPSIK